MSRIAIIFFFVRVSSFAQEIATPTVLAQEFPGVSRVLVIVETRTPYTGIKGARSLFTDRDGSLFVNLCNYYGTRGIKAMAAGTYLDTLDLGILPVGKYRLTIKYSSAVNGQSCEEGKQLTGRYLIAVGYREDEPAEPY